MSLFKVTGAALAAIALGFVVVVLIATMAIFGWGFFQRSTANFRGQTGAIEQVQGNPDFRISSYNRFFDLCSAIQADEGRLSALKAELRTHPTAERRGELHTDITAVTASRIEKIRQYNADASKSFTAGQFRDSHLPYQIDVRGETTCALP